MVAGNRNRTGVKVEGSASVDQARPPEATARVCRFCGGHLHPFVDLGMSPLCESFVPADRLHAMEAFYPLDVMVCGTCFLVQLPQYVNPEAIFTEYAYFSSYSDAYVAHGKAYAEMIVERLGLSDRSLVVELASNDGYLLQHFLGKGVPVLGVEPAANVAQAAIARGIPTDVVFFGAETARRMVADGKVADLLIGNNVLAQVPDLNDFVAGMRIVLAPEGVATVEFPHLMRLIADGQYDTIYHEHFSYFSFTTAERIFAAHGLRVFDVEEIWTHGGSLRLYACHAAADRPTGQAVSALRRREHDAGYARLETYADFGEKAKAAKRDLLDFLIGVKRAGKRVVGYGAPGKGNTLLNYCGIRTDFLDFTVDRNPYKHGKFLPGTHIPIYPPDRIAATRPDYVLILPWNLKDEIVAQLAYIRTWGGRCVVPIPRVEICP
ncbi:MAG: methyltransferase domain-containing protein [Rhodospirillales bacterium]|nr:methyltransferase domain-containing protein [Rhodospirillales bacterium]